MCKRYLDLMKACLTRSVFDTLTPEQLNERKLGRDWPKTAETMVGHARLDCIQQSAETIFRDKIHGDFLEAGVWRGGASIFMRALLDQEPDRIMWVADSFEGLPHPNPEKYPIDIGDTHHLHRFLAVSLDEVKGNFERYSLLDERVQFLSGWFKDTLPGPVEHLAMLRLDGDMYESTLQTLEALYDKVSPGGFVLVDDYALHGARAATDDFRTKMGIHAPLVHVDWTGVWWRKPALERWA
jgi:O-methyltransferase